jgi:cullin 1
MAMARLEERPQDDVSASEIHFPNELSYQDIATGTSLGDSTLKPQLALLVKAKVLLLDDDTYELNLSEFPPLFHIGYCILLRCNTASLFEMGMLPDQADRPDFKSKKIRVVLNQPVKSEQKAEVAEVLQAVDEDRKFIYQATIVRLMKSRKVSSRVHCCFSIVQAHA